MTETRKKAPAKQPTGTAAAQRRKTTEAPAPAAPAAPAAPGAGLRFVVTGCGRSGTKYTAHLLTRAGLACGHEDIFNRWGPDAQLPENWHTQAFDGDASFIAAPFTEQLAASGLRVVHQVRPPLDVIRSICGIAWLRDLQIPYVAFITAHVPAVAEQPPGPRRAAAYWLGWNALAAQHAHVTWRLSELTAGDVTALAEHVGLTADAERTAAAMERTPRTINHRQRTQVELADLGPLADAVTEAAARYGVPLETGEETTG